MTVLNGEELKAGGLIQELDDWKVTAGITPVMQEITASTFTYNGDVTKFYLMNSSSPQTVTIPLGLSSLEVGSVVTFIRNGEGTVTFVEEAGVTINSVSDILQISDRYAVAQICKIGNNTYILIGG